MSVSLRTTILATGCILAVGTSAARAQMPLVFYYPAPGNYATTQGTVHIPAAGYYYNVPLGAVPAPVNPAPAPAQRSTYFSFSSYRGAPSSGYYGGVGGPGVEANVRPRGSAYVGGDEEDNPDW